MELKDEFPLSTKIFVVLLFICCLIFLVFLTSFYSQPYDYLFYIGFIVTGPIVWLATLQALFYRIKIEKNKSIALRTLFGDLRISSNQIKKISYKTVPRPITGPGARSYKVLIIQLKTEQKIYYQLSPFINTKELQLAIEKNTNIKLTNSGKTKFVEEYILLAKVSLTYILGRLIHLV